MYSPLLTRDTDAERALGANADDGPQRRLPSSSTVLKIVSVLLVGAFTSNGDSSLVLATHPTIASEFDCLSASSWLFVSFSLAGAATQTLVSPALMSLERVLSNSLHAFGSYDHSIV